MTSVVNMRLDYAQVRSLAMQLNNDDKLTLSSELKQASMLASLRQLKEALESDDFSDDEIRQECEAVRQEMYEKRIANC